ncbi:MAG: nitroreductase, partial [Clostridia bacterium]|nr:nitroreductase [Clostridia bacterium]
GVMHRFKNPDNLIEVKGEMPEWFKNGFEMAKYAPTAMNQQQWKLTLKGDKVKAKALLGPYSKVDLGIVKYHFEVGANKDSSIWE